MSIVYIRRIILFLLVLIDGFTSDVFVSFSESSWWC